MAKYCVNISWEEAPHLTKEQKETILAGIPPWQRDSRTKGIPQLGAGAIYAIPESEIVVDGFPIPPHWPRAYGMDVGWNRTAVIFAAWDRDSGSVYIYDEYYRGQAEPSVHAAAIKNRGAWIAGVIDPAARGRSQHDGAQLLQLYLDLGLDIDDADNSKEAGIYRVWELLSQGQLKIFKSCTNTLAEYRLYRRDEKGQVIKKNDHLMDALRYVIMSGSDRARVEPKRGPNGTEWFHWAPPIVWSG